MKRILIFICLAATFLGCGMNADAKKKDIAFQMYSVRELIGNPEKFAQNHKEVLAKLAAMGYTATEAANYDNDGGHSASTHTSVPACSTS